MSSIVFPAVSCTVSWYILCQIGALRSKPSALVGLARLAQKQRELSFLRERYKHNTFSQPPHYGRTTPEASFLPLRSIPHGRRHHSKTTFGIWRTQRSTYRTAENRVHQLSSCAFLRSPGGVWLDLTNCLFETEAGHGVTDMASFHLPREKKKSVGSVLIVESESLEEIQKFLEADVFYTNDIVSLVSCWMVIWS